MSAESVQTVFGSIGSIIDQATNSILKIEDATARYRGTQPTRTAGSMGSVFTLPRYTTAQWAGVGILGLVLVLGAVVLYREFK